MTGDPISETQGCQEKTILAKTFSLTTIQGPTKRQGIKFKIRRH
jgi:hypothetical protein